MIAKSVALLSLAVLSGVAAADCSREDVDHYLDRGFTPDQVVSLCAGAAAPVDTGGGLMQALRDAIAAMDVVVDDSALSYTRELCVHYGPENLAQQRKKACGLAHYRIARAGLSVLDGRRKVLFWGRNAVEVEGAIERRYDIGQAQLDPDDAQRLEQELEQGGRTEIPVREGVSLDRVKGLLNELVLPQ